MPPRYSALEVCNNVLYNCSTNPATNCNCFKIRKSIDNNFFAILYRSSATSVLSMQSNYWRCDVRDPMQRQRRWSQWDNSVLIRIAFLSTIHLHTADLLLALSTESRGQPLTREDVAPPKWSLPLSMAQRFNYSLRRGFISVQPVKRTLISCPVRELSLSVRFIEGKKNTPDDSSSSGAPREGSQICWIIKMHGSGWI